MHVYTTTQTAGVGLYYVPMSPIEYLLITRGCHSKMLLAVNFVYLCCIHFQLVIKAILLSSVWMRLSISNPRTAREVEGRQEKQLLADKPLTCWRSYRPDTYHMRYMRAGVVV